MATSAEILRAYRGPALFSYGFRPFFLGGAIWAVTAMALFVAVLWGGLYMPTTFHPVDWHVHELLFGYVPAVAAGFLLTAVPNWTGRLPIAGTPLAALFEIWLAGRAAVAFSGLIGAGPAAAIDLAFLAVFSAVIAREIIAGRNTRNLKVLVLLGLLTLGNAVFHVEAATRGSADYGKRFGVGAVILLIMLIGGRIVPSFTRNWLARQNPGALPAPFGRFDSGAIAIGAAAIALWVLLPDNPATAIAAVIAGGVHLVRLARWRGLRTFNEPLVTVLHAGYAFIPLGFLLLALSIAAPESLSPAAAAHGWTAGAVGLMTMAVMTRATLGHVGREMTASRAILAIYMAVGVGAIARILAGFGVEPDLMLKIAALGWILAFGGFVCVFGPLLGRARG